MHASDSSDSHPFVPWGGYESLEAQVDALRRARFRVGRTFEISDRGLVAQGTITEGSVKVGMVLLADLERWPSICTAIPIQAVEALRDTDGSGSVELVLGDVMKATGDAALQLAPGTIIDVLEHAPAA